MASPSPQSQDPPHSSSASNTAPPPNFQPFFTLISPTHPGAAHSHPKVHYIFSDDDFDPAPPSDPSERVIVVDIAPSGNTVLNARSYSADFQVVNVGISSAPQMHDNPTEGGLMLSIEGVEGRLRGVKASDGVQELGDAFFERMTMLKRVIEFGDGPVLPGVGADSVDTQIPAPQPQQLESQASTS